MTHETDMGLTHERHTSRALTRIFYNTTQGPTTQINRNRAGLYKRPAQHLLIFYLAVSLQCYKSFPS